MYCSRSVCGCMRVVTGWGVVVLKKEEENDDRPERGRMTSLNVLRECFVCGGTIVGVLEILRLSQLPAVLVDLISATTFFTCCAWDVTCRPDLHGWGCRHL
jgi:hypothetical protein